MPNNPGPDNNPPRSIIEPRYTLDEARRELDRLQCRSNGHDWNIISTVAYYNGRPVAIVCERCGLRYSVVDSA